MNIEILFIADDFLARHDGGLVDVYGQLLILNATPNINIDLLVATNNADFNNYNALKNTGNIKHVNCYVKNKHSKLRKFLSFLPSDCYTYIDLLKFKSAKHYDYVICQREYSAIVTQNIKYKNLIIRVHNDEHEFFAINNSFNSLFKKTISYLNYFKIRHITQKYYKLAHSLWFISDYERQKFSLSLPNKCITFPPYYKNTDAFTGSMHNHKVLFVGSFAPLNLEGIKWYFNHVHDRLKQQVSNYTITLVGSYCGFDISWLQCIAKHDESVTLQVNVACNLLPNIYKEHALAINPMRRGSGVKIKTIEYIYNNLPVVTTTVGSVGNLLKDQEGIVIADSPCDFVDKMVELLLNPTLADTIINCGHNKINELHEYNIKLLKQELK